MPEKARFFKSPHGSAIFRPYESMHPGNFSRLADFAQSSFNQQATISGAAEIVGNTHINVRFTITLPTAAATPS